MASISDATRSFQRDGSLHLVVWAAAFVSALAVGVAWMELPLSDLWIVLIYLVLSATLSSALGFGVYRWTEVRRRSIRTKVILAHALGAAIVIVNIYAAAQLMFISAHDLGLLMLLLVACAVFSVTFGAAVADRMTSAVRQLSDGAVEVARGNFEARVDVSTNDELADLARSFNAMVAHVNESAELRLRAESARRDLIAAVSHDLRTPLTAVRAMLEALADGVVDDPATISRYHTTMRAQVDHLSRLIDDLFELSQLDAGGLRVELVTCDLAGVVGDAVESFAMGAASRSVQVTFCADRPLTAEVEPERIARVINNLVDNALRHAPDGTRIAVSVVRLVDAAVVDVRDQGPGIDPADMPHLFERFFRGERSRSRAYGGAGLGLAIAHGIVEAHGGRIWAENPPGGGARFAFSIPLAREGAR